MDATGGLACPWLALLALLPFAPPSDAAFPGDNGKIAYSVFSYEAENVYFTCTRNPDGTGRNCFKIISTAEPSWAPDGARLAVSDFSGIWTVDPDGSAATQLIVSEDEFGAPAWSPDGLRIAFSSFRDGNYEIYVMNADGTGQTRLTSGVATDYAPAWSPDGMWIAFMSDRDGNYEIYKMRADGTGATRLTNDPGEDIAPVWSPDGRRIAFESKFHNVEVVDPDGHGRAVLLACTSPNRTHGGPLAYPSCAPPSPTSSNLTIGVGDGTPPAAKSVGSVELKALVGTPGPPDDADVAIGVRVTNVMKASDNSDYTGELRLELPLRITDGFNTPSPSGYGPGTVSETSFYAAVPCTATADPTLGSTCTLSVTADALLPGTVRQGARAIWGLGQVRLHDGGADGDADTPGDNQLFAVQGIFEP